MEVTKDFVHMYHRVFHPVNPVNSTRFPVLTSRMLLLFRVMSGSLPCDVGF